MCEKMSSSRSVSLPVDSPGMRALMKQMPALAGASPDTVTAQVNVVNLGNAQILTIPGEALPNIGYYLKRKMHGEHNLLFGLTNDAYGYILTKEDFDGVPIIHIWGVGDGAVTAAGDDGPEGVDEGAETGGLIARRFLLEQGDGLGGSTGEQRLGHGVGEPARCVVVLAAVAAVGEVAGAGFGAGLRGGGLQAVAMRLSTPEIINLAKHA